MEESVVKYLIYLQKSTKSTTRLNREHNLFSYEGAERTEPCKTDVQGHLKKIVSLTFWSKGCHEEVKDGSEGALQQRHPVPPGSFKASLNSVTEFIPTGLLLSHTNTQISPPPCLSTHSSPFSPASCPTRVPWTPYLIHRPLLFFFILPFVLWDGERKKGKRGGWGGGEGKERDLWLAFRWFHMKRQHTLKLPPPVTHSVSLASVEYTWVSLQLPLNSPGRHT